MALLSLHSGWQVKVTIAIPTYQGEPYVRAAVESVLGQAGVTEVLVVDDHSADTTFDTVCQLRDPRLRLYRNAERLGLVDNWNRCLALATGDFIQIFHQDDLLLPDSVAHSAAVLDAWPEVGLVFGNIITIDADGQLVGGHWNPLLPDQDTRFCGPELFRLLLAHGNLIPCQTVMVRASLYCELGGFNRGLAYTPDLEMWLRLLLHVDAVYLSQPIVALRRHSRQLTQAFAGRADEVNEVRAAIDAVFARYPDRIRDRAALYQLALGQLERWSWGQLRWSLRQRRWPSAISFGRALARCRLAVWRGAPA